MKMKKKEEKGSEGERRNGITGREGKGNAEMIKVGIFCVLTRKTLYF